MTLRAHQRVAARWRARRLLGQRGWETAAGAVCGVAVAGGSLADPGGVAGAAVAVSAAGGFALIAQIYAAGSMQTLRCFRLCTKVSWAGQVECMAVVARAGRRSRWRAGARDTVQDWCSTNDANPAQARRRTVAAAALDRAVQGGGTDWSQLKADMASLGGVAGRLLDAAGARGDDVELVELAGWARRLEDAAASDVACVLLEDNPALEILQAIEAAEAVAVTP